MTSAPDRPAPNGRLRRAMAAAGMSPAGLAARVGVDPKTVQRWLGGRVPHLRHRLATVEALGCAEHHLWPERAVAAVGAGHEIRAAYSAQALVPSQLWVQVIERATSEICLLDEHGLHLLQDRQLRQALLDRLCSGVCLRVCLTLPAHTGSARRRPSASGEPRAGQRPPGGAATGSDAGESPAVDAPRCSGCDPATELRLAQIRLGLARLHELHAQVPDGRPGVHVRLRSSPTSVFLLVTDTELLVTQLLGDSHAGVSPTVHLRLPPAGLMASDSLAGAYQHVWRSAWATARDAMGQPAVHRGGAWDAAVAG